MDKKTEALKLALEAGFDEAGSSTDEWYEAGIENIVRLVELAKHKALAEQPAQQQEPYGWKVYGVNSLFMGEFAEADAKAEAKRIGGTCITFPLYTSPPASKPWVGLMRGVRVEGDAVVITVKSGNKHARELCEALLREKNA